MDLGNRFHFLASEILFSQWKAERRNEKIPLYWSKVTCKNMIVIIVYSLIAYRFIIV